MDQEEYLSEHGQTTSANFKIWSNSDTNQLISLYNSLISKVGKKFRYQKEIWDEISLHFPDKSPQQCETRLKTVLRRNKTNVVKRVHLTEREQKSDTQEEEDEINGLQVLTTNKIWSKSETNQLITLYNNLISKIGEKFKYQKDIWQEISLHFPGKTPLQCETRLRTVLRRRKGVKRVYISGTEGNSNNLRDEQTDDVIPNVKCINFWSSSDEKLLEDLYKKLICEVWPARRFKQKKGMWAEISTHFPNKTAIQCENRFKHFLTNQRKRALQRRKTLDSKAKDCFEPKLQIRTVYSLNKEFNADNKIEMKGHNLQKNNELSLPETEKTFESENKHLNEQENRERSIQQILLDLYAKKEEARERRHREKLDVIKETQCILQQLLNSVNNE